VKQRHTAASLEPLLRVYAHKVQVSKFGVLEQLEKVSKTKQELIERQALIAALDVQIAENWRFMTEVSNGRSAVEQQAASRHRYWIDYDKQKETFYLELTYAELDEHQAELKLRQQLHAKLEAKNDALHDLLKKSLRSKRRRLKNRADAEHVDLLLAGGTNGQK